jgi:hypothetical protein
MGHFRCVAPGPVASLSLDEPRGIGRVGRGQSALRLRHSGSRPGSASSSAVPDLDPYVGKAGSSIGNGCADCIVSRDCPSGCGVRRRKHIALHRGPVEHGFVHDTLADAHVGFSRSSIPGIAPRSMLEVGISDVRRDGESGADRARGEGP